MVSIVSAVIVDVSNVEYSMFGWYKCTCIWGRFGDYFTILSDHAVVESSICEWKFSDVSEITTFCVHKEILITCMSVLLYCGVKRLPSGPNHLSHWYIQFIWIRVAVSKLVITVEWFSAYRNRKAVQNALHPIYINHHSWLHCATHNAKPCPLCKHWTQFSAYDKPFDWLEIVSRYNWPMVRTFACSSLSPCADH